jgi:hypothetical protein
VDDELAELLERGALGDEARERWGVVGGDEVEDRLGDALWLARRRRPDLGDQPLEHRLLDARAESDQRRIPLAVVVDPVEPAVVELVREEEPELEVVVRERVPGPVRRRAERISAAKSLDQGFADRAPGLGYQHGGRLPDQL